MPVEPAHFLKPVGRLDPSLLGGDPAATSTLTALITAAQGVTNDENAQACWVYWHAFDRISDDAMADPTMQRDLNKTSQFSDAQLLHWSRLARSYERCYKRAIGQAEAFPRGSRLRDARSRF